MATLQTLPEKGVVPCALIPSVLDHIVDKTRVMIHNTG